MPLQMFDRELIETLELLLTKAKAGEITGILYSVELDPGNHQMGLSRTYAEQPYAVLNVVTRAQYRMNQLISRLAREPSSGMMSL